MSCPSTSTAIQINSHPSKSTGPYLSEALAAHHGDVGKADGQDERRAVGRSRHGAKGLRIALEAGVGTGGYHWVGGEEGGEVRLGGEWIGVVW